jgi:hypothetical protein
MKASICGAVLLALSGVVVHAVLASGELPEAPVPVAWDRDVCGHCRMHVGEPRHAVQLVTVDGDVTNFDDVGCALRYLATRDPDVHRLWFHGPGETWLPADRAGFVRTAATPMGSGLLAVERSTSGARSLDDVRAEVAP